MIRNERDYIDDILDSINRIGSFVAGMSYASFEKDEKTVYAVIRALEIMGEAVKNISSATKKRYTDIPWKDIAGMRDILSHAYFGVKLAVIWETATVEIPPLKPKIMMVKKNL